MAINGLLSNSSGLLEGVDEVASIAAPCQLLLASAAAGDAGPSPAQGASAAGVFTTMLTQVLARSHRTFMDLVAHRAASCRVLCDPSQSAGISSLPDDELNAELKLHQTLDAASIKRAAPLLAKLNDRIGSKQGLALLNESIANCLVTFDAGSLRMYADMAVAAVEAPSLAKLGRTLVDIANVHVCDPRVQDDGVAGGNQSSASLLNAAFMPSAALQGVTPITLTVPQRSLLVRLLLDYGHATGSVVHVLRAVHVLCCIRAREEVSPAHHTAVSVINSPHNSSISHTGSTSTPVNSSPARSASVSGTGSSLSGLASSGSSFALGGGSNSVTGTPPQPLSIISSLKRYADTVQVEIRSLMASLSDPSSRGSAVSGLGRGAHDAANTFISIILANPELALPDGYAYCLMPFSTPVLLCGAAVWASTASLCYVFVADKSTVRSSLEPSPLTQPFDSSYLNWVSARSCMS